MKINPEIKKARQQAKNQYFEARRKLQRINKQVRDEENDILEAMFCELSKTDKPLTAAEISARLNEAMSKHEVAGQLKLICNPFGRTQFPSHDSIRREKNKKLVRKMERIQIKRFAEIDDKGKIVSGGKVFETIKTYNAYIKFSADAE